MLKRENIDIDFIGGRLVLMWVGFIPYSFLYNLKLNYREMA
jgi:hypothetical protein